MISNFKTFVFMIFCGFFIISCEKTEYSSPEDAIIDQQASDNKVEVILENGNKISFQTINDGELKGTFLLEESDCEQCSFLTNIGELIEDPTAQEIFWAISKPDTPIPSFLRLKDKSVFKTKKAQGWARSISRDFPIGTGGSSRIVACTNSKFTSSIAGGFLGTPEFIALDKTPNNYDGFVNDCASLTPSACNKGPRYKLHATMRGIKKWKGKICSKAVQNSTNDHYISNSPSGSICQSPPCSSYRGPELYFEYFANGKWKSMKNPNSAIPQGFEVPANTTKVYTYSWKTNVNTSFRLRVKNAMGKDQFDFMMDRVDVVTGGGDGGNGTGNGGGSGNDGSVIPDYISVSNDSYMIVDFTSMVDDQPSPQITIPSGALEAYFNNEGGIVLPEEFCGIRIMSADNFQWMNSDNEVVANTTFNKVGDLYNYGDFNYALAGIEFSGPFDNCENNSNNWDFEYPLANNQPTVFNEPLKLMIQLIDIGSEVIFLE
ncbi:hypothetical protein [Aquimarina sp. 2201CG5-10]|uniref:hypothetical protein n=1 Tax=Aquimarina callyspongiae TaxID=3098150 RepID=UPI002AB32D70|nr:hypothetical protein [Aquimarina sp. 2201CG5-10]MDY8137048.1 hypothetical protein [Aquimarina sp. 2201CG5-10]